MKKPSKNSNQTRRNISSELKVAVVKQHLIDGKSVADLCDEHQIQPTQFYQWQKMLFENGTAAFDKQSNKKQAGKSIEKRKIEHLEDKLISKNEVISELMEENIKVKKANGDL
jgi:transposase-like protein